MTGAERLHYMTVLAEEQNLTKAAARLFISQPALTAFINRLESEVGVRLFDRTRTPVTLTEAGAYYLSELHSLEAKRTEILNNLRGMEKKNEGSLTVSIGRNRGSLWLPSVTQKLYSRFPGLRISIDESRDADMAEAVRRGYSDVAVIETFACVGSLSCTPLGEEIHTIVASPSLPAFSSYSTESCSPLHPLDIPGDILSRERFFCPSVKGSLSDATLHLFEEYQVHPSEIIFIGNNATSYQMAVMGQGITYLCTEYARLIPSGQKPLFIMPGGQPDRRRLYAVTASGKRNRYISAFISAMQEALTNPPDPLP